MYLRLQSYLFTAFIFLLFISVVEIKFDALLGIDEAGQVSVYPKNTSSGCHNVLI